MGQPANFIRPVGPFWSGLCYHRRMGQEKRPDMFDVGAGECTLVDFLLTRFDAMDLRSRISLEPGSRFFEQMVAAPTISAAGAVPVQVGEAPAAPVQVIEVPVSVAEEAPAPSLPPGPGAVPEAASFTPSPRPAAGADGSDAFVRSEPDENAASSAETFTPAEADSPPASADLMSLMIQNFQEAAKRYQTEKTASEEHEQSE